VEVPPRVGQARGAVAFCLELHDLVLSKCVAGRERDWDFAGHALEAGLVKINELLSLVGDLPIEMSEQERLRGRLGDLADKLDLG
jgi:hypothetical protein